MNETSNGACEMPKYSCNDPIWALKIKYFDRYIPTIDELNRILNHFDTNSNEMYKYSDDIGGFITPEDLRYAKFSVSRDYVQTYNPTSDGYYIVYKNGHQSFLPTIIFENLYSCITT